jgi:hypothetical protein
MHVSNMSRAFRLARLLATQLRGNANALTSARSFSDDTSRKVTVMAGSGDLAGRLRSGRPSYPRSFELASRPGVPLNRRQPMFGESLVPCGVYRWQSAGRISSIGREHLQ